MMVKVFFGTFTIVRRQTGNHMVGAMPQSRPRQMLKRLGFGGILWLVPYVTAIPLMPLIQSDPTFFKTIMIVVGTLVGGLLAVLYFLDVEKDFLKEGILLAVVWIVVNWLLDFVALLPFTKQSVPRYFMEIGLRYIAMVAPTVSLGYVLGRKLEGRGIGGRNAA